MDQIKSSTSAPFISPFFAACKDQGSMSLYDSNIQFGK